MTAGFVHNLKPKEVQEGRYDVSTGTCRRGGYTLGVAGLEVGGYASPSLPIAVDSKAKTAKIAVRVLVVETVDISATETKVAKDPYIKDGMTLSIGRNGAVVQSIGCINADCDKVMLAATFGAKISTGDALFEVSATEGTTPKAVANSALYGNHKIMEDINSVAPLVRTFEIESEELVTPFCAADKANLLRFQFSEQEERVGL